MANDFLTLDEIAAQHETMLERVIAGSRDKSFDSPFESFRYITWCIHTGLQKLGLNISKNMPATVVQGLLDQKKIKIEQHKYGEHPGMFVYVDDELKWYISGVERRMEQNGIVLSAPIFIVRTNVR